MTNKKLITEMETVNKSWSKYKISYFTFCIYFRLLYGNESIRDISKNDLISSSFRRLLSRFKA